MSKLTEELETALSAREDGYAQRLARIEKASIVLKDMSLLVSRGRDRIRAAEAFDRVMALTAELRANRNGPEEVVVKEGGPPVQSAIPATTVERP